ncbi:16S rRNA (guanine(527)-N(7))-methyltransferase RsmG [Roseomonas populi]|uniref:Ribosomal RNA small subunit methyltransferase G n=1 Tax=Roseomonas populi TaxID=3121582 RepID=A0ABT1X723_9PROT|nr:16S rRNA (guanine(527)-N(7))-methyltransferase RsmG [Roseomonas pecuniae]MCR0983902.1 16S rRNA (guanine(527)-N(7))-methyltransferase RsmG [Roseomonas pecuniae]
MRTPEPVVSRETEARLDGFLSLLLRWNARINLVAERDPETLRARHIADSLQLLPLLPGGGGEAADLGTGGGFPGLVLAIADTGRSWNLVESDRRKAAFLTAAAGELGLSHVRVHTRRIEAVTLPPLALVTARALAPLPVLLGHAARLLSPGGTALFPKGRSAADELTAAEAEWTMHTERFESRTEPGATILRITELHRAGS